MAKLEWAILISEVVSQLNAEEEQMAIDFRINGKGVGFAFIDYSNGLLAGIAEISIDRSNGKIKVHNFWCSIDCGTPVQPDNVIAHTHIRIFYGLGFALSERISIKNGLLEQSN